MDDDENDMVDDEANEVDFVDDKNSPLDKEYVTSQVHGEVFHLPKRYETEEIIGSGTYGVVVRCHDHKRDAKVAIKRIRLSLNEHDLTRIVLREVKVLKHLGKHSNIVRMHDLIPPPQPMERINACDDSIDEIYVVMEYMLCSLHRVLSDPHVEVGIENIRYFMFNLLKGLKYIHSAGIIHRDIKPSNILLNERMEIKYCDFGMAAPCNNVDPMNTLYVVTRHYRAPELCILYEYSSFPVDIWSLGCILGQMLCRKILFPGANSFSQMESIFRILGFPSDQDALKGRDDCKSYAKKEWGHYKGESLASLFPNADEDILDLLKAMLQINPNKRITVDQALNHKFFNGEGKDIPTAKSLFSFNVPENTEPNCLKEMLQKEVMSYYYAGN